ncbi:MAG TPA: competence/damage-inducible protein A [Candidatus Cloacimonetes bacterium]|nr:competence/damage-inducible protein A [Candidatus Cloacimonadota bacterium]
MIKILYISIGNEILMGKTVNTNETFIGEHLFSAGFHLDKSVTIGDDKKAITDTLSYAWENYDVTIITGGLGPTHDDITKAAVASFFNKKMHFHEDIWNDIKAWYDKLDKTPPDIVKTQAEIPEDFISIKNANGTAPGLHYIDNDKHIFVLPGVPKEMKPMITEYVVPALKEKFASESLNQCTIRTFGLFESELFSTLKDIEETNTTRIAFLPKAGMVDIRLFGVSKDEIEALRKQIENKIDPKYIYGYDDETLVQVFHKEMMASGKTVSAAESCTGGLIQSMITDNAGSSDYFLGGVVSYSNQAKMKLLGVEQTTLERWGAVSEQTVKEMVVGTIKLFSSDYAIAVSGIAGPGGGTEEKPVGLVYIGTFGKGGLKITENHFHSSRTDVKEQTANRAIYQILTNE